ncbi:MAG TPA: hypothetical protein VL354_11725 [Spirochaetia bacterium]|nr:hypothetical protein [Spirochaetia bacterium]
MRGGLVVALTDLATYWELSSSYLKALAPFFASQRRKLEVDLRTDPQRTILVFCYVAGDGAEKAIQVELPRERGTIGR